MMQNRRCPIRCRRRLQSPMVRPENRNSATGVVSYKTSPSPRGFTLLEITVVSGLMVFLAVLLSAAWFGIGKTTVDLVARGQLSQEIDVATISLSHDFGGSLPTPAASLQGTRQAGRLLDWRRSLTEPQVLELCYDSGSDPNNTADWLDADSSDTIVRYSWDQDEHALIRTQVRVGDTPRQFTVARNIDSFSFTLDSDKTLHVALTFACYFSWDLQRTHPIVKRTCKFVAKM
jgi:type II secretory pathway pseudopilin PulG